MAPPHLAPSAAVLLASAAAVAFVATAALSLLAADATPVVVVFDAMVHLYNNSAYNGTASPDAPRDALIGDATGAGFVAPSPTDSSRRVAWAVRPTPEYFANIFVPSPPLPPRNPNDRKRGNGPRAPRRATAPVASSPASSPPSSPPSTTSPASGPPPPPAPSPPPSPTPAPTPAPEVAPVPAPAPAPPPPPAPAPEPEPGGGGGGDPGGDPDDDDDEIDELFDGFLDRMKLSKGLLKMSEKMCKCWGEGKKSERTKTRKLRAKVKKLEKKLRRKSRATSTYHYHQYCGSPPAPMKNE